MKKKYVFFDLDGTLADTDADIRSAWKAAIADLGLECPRFDELFVAGPPFDESVRILFPDIATPALADGIRRSFALHYDNDGFPLTKEYPGVMDEVRRLKASGCVVAIVTNKRYAGAAAMVRHFGWDGVFDGVYAGDMFLSPGADERFVRAGVEIPHRRMRKPELLSLVMRLYGASAGDSVMIGDTAGDFEAAAANGVESIGVCWGYGTDEELSAAGALCRDLPFPL